jgi:hypothetical protein
MRRLELQATENSSEPGTTTEYNNAAPARQAAATLKQLKKGDPWPICAVRQDRRPCQPTESDPHQQ